VSSFNLGQEIGELTYNFEPWAGAGSIPEPSSVQIQAFRQALGEVFALGQEEGEEKQDPNDPAQFAKMLNQFLSQDTTEVDEKMLHLAAAVCSDSPSFDDLQALPFRGRQAFLGWLVGVLLVPETSRPATTQ
jgi:hypothetical protein